MSTQPPKKKQKRQKPKISWVWQHFDKLSSRSAKCKLCLMVYESCGNTTNLTKHLNSAHSLTAPEPKAPAKAGEPSTSSSQPAEPEPEAGSSQPQSSSDGTENAPPKRRVQSDQASAPPKKAKLSDKSSGIDGYFSNLNQASAPPKKAKLSDKSSGIDGYFSNLNSMTKGGFKYVKIVGAIMFWIVKDMLPFRSVEKEGFRHLMKTIVPNFDVPCRNTIKQWTEKKYDSVVETMREKFKKIRFFTLTSDIWTESKNTKSFISLTAHFIHDGVIRSLPLGVEPLTERHEGSYITEVLDKILDFWRIPKDKIVAMMTDNGANMVNGACGFVGRAKFIPCFAHTLQLVPEAIFKDEAVDALIRKISRIVTLFKQSVVAADELRQKQEGTPLKLIQCCETRWNSVYYMIERFLLLLPFINAIIINYAHIDAITGAEVEMLREMQQVLCHIAFVTKEMSGELYACGSKIIPSLRILRMHLGSLKLKTDLGKKVLDLALKNLDKRFSKVEEVRLLAIATILDPRFKIMHFVNSTASTNALNRINVLMRESITDAEKDQTEEGEATTKEKEPEKPHEFWGLHDKLIEQQGTSSHSDENVHVYLPELKQYLSLPCEKRETDPVKYWIENEKAMPLLSKIALKHLIIVGTSVPSERVFSKSGEHYTRDRNRLGSKLLGKLLFLQALPFLDWFL